MKKRWFWFLIFIFMLLLTFVWATTTNLDTDTYLSLRSISRLMAFLGIGFFLVQFVLSCRIKFIEQIFGLDKMLWYHRWFGRAAVGFLFIHFSLLFVPEIINLGFVPLTIFRLFGSLSLMIIAIAATLASLYKKLHLSYEIWKGIHLINYVAFPLAIIHVGLQAASLNTYLLWSLMAFIYLFFVGYRLKSIYTIRKNPFTITNIRRENHDTWSLMFSGKPINYLPGQFLHVQLLREDGLSFSHPFTISSSPTQSLVSITPKELGDFTDTIGKTEQGDLAYIDAPYGVFSFLKVSEEQPLIFIAGGIGITPFISMLRYMHDQKIERRVFLFWGNKTEDNLLFQQEFEDIESNLSGLTIVQVMSEDEDWAGEKGYIDANMIEKYAGDLRDYDIFLCGPPPMSQAIQQDLQAHQVPNSQIHREIFEL